MEKGDRKRTRKVKKSCECEWWKIIEKDGDEEGQGGEQWEGRGGTARA